MQILGLILRTKHRRAFCGNRIAKLRHRWDPHHADRMTQATKYGSQLGRTRWLTKRSKWALSNGVLFQWLAVSKNIIIVNERFIVDLSRTAQRIKTTGFVGLKNIFINFYTLFEERKLDIKYTELWRTRKVEAYDPRHCVKCIGYYANCWQKVEDRIVQKLNISESIPLF